MNSRRGHIRSRCKQIKTLNMELQKAILRNVKFYFNRKGQLNFLSIQSIATCKNRINNILLKSKWTTGLTHPSKAMDGK